MKLLDFDFCCIEMLLNCFTDKKSAVDIGPMEIKRTSNGKHFGHSSSSQLSQFDAGF